MKWMLVFLVFAHLTTLNNAAAQDLCDTYMVEHTPRADVAHNPSPVIVPDPVQIPLTIDMAEYYALDIAEGTLLEAEIGMIEIYKDGRIFYNNQDITGDIKDKCTDDEHEFEAIIEQQTKNGDNTDP